MAIQFQTPTNATEVIQNIKLAFEKGWLHEDGFYTEDNLKAFLGAKNIQLLNDETGNFFKASDLGFSTKLNVQGGYISDHKKFIIDISNLDSLSVADHNSELSLLFVKKWFENDPQWQPAKQKNIISDDPEHEASFEKYELVQAPNKKVSLIFAKSWALDSASFEEQL